MLKVVYVYLGSQADQYLAMLQISLASLRCRMPTIPVEILTDEKTTDFLMANQETVCTDPYTKLQTIEIPSKYTQAEGSRYLKTNLRSLVQGDFVFLDCDTVICADFSDVVLTDSVSMVLDCHKTLKKENARDRITIQGGHERGFDLSKIENYFNSGVMLVKDDEKAHDLFAKWFECWERTRLPGKHQDQYSLNVINAENPVISELDFSWNLQIAASPSVVHLVAKAKVIHYFSVYKSGVYLLNDSALLKQGLENEQVLKIIENPQDAFKACYLCACDSPQGKIMDSAQFRVLNRMYHKNEKMFYFLDKVLRKIFRLKD